MSLHADEDDASPNTPISSTGNTHYGLFGLLDHRSSYGRDVFPDPFLVEDSDLEESALRLDWFHTKAGAARSDVGTVEVEQGFGLFTLQLQASYERDASPEGVEQGASDIEIGIRHPFFQYVAPNNLFDTTIGASVVVGIPTNSPFSKDTQFVPQIFNDLRFGSHLTLQSVGGYAIQFGPGQDGGLHVFEYGFALASTFRHEELPLPGVNQFIPMFEISGEKQLNHGDTSNSVLATAGFRVNLKGIGPFQPRIGIAYVFPLNGTAREEIHHGIYTSLVFEF